MALDPSYFFYSDGTITLTNGSDIATGDMVVWDPAVLPFDFVFPNDGTGGMSVIKEVLAVNQIRLAKPWTGPTLTAVPYFMVRWANHIDPRFYAIRVSEYLARLKTIPDNLEQIAGEIDADRQAVDAAMVTLQQIEASIEADRLAVAADRSAADGAAAAAAASADEAEAWAQAASSGVLPDNSVTNAKLADMPAGTIKGADVAGAPKDLTPAQVRQMLKSELDTYYGLPMSKAPPELVWVNGTTITVKAGKCRDELDTVNLVNPADFNVTLAGAPVNAHRYVLLGINGSGVLAAVFSDLDALPSGWQAYRRLGSVFTDNAGAIVRFIQTGDEFEWYSAILEMDASSGVSTGAALQTVKVPPRCLGHFIATMNGSTTDTFFVWNPDTVRPETDGYRLNTVTVYGTGYASETFDCRTNASRHVYRRSSAGANPVRLWNTGYVDRRGRDK